MKHVEKIPAVESDDSMSDGDRPIQNETTSNDGLGFANLTGVGDSIGESDDEAPLEALAISDIPSETLHMACNDEPALEKKLSEIGIFAKGNQSALPFWESLTVTMPLSEKLPDSLALDDLKRERRFAELTTEAVHIGLERLRREKVKFRRPGDYFAEMVKSDGHMGKVKAQILHHKSKIEKAEQGRNNRDVEKRKKKVRAEQLEKEQNKKRKAKEEIEAFSRLRKQRLRERTGGTDGGLDNDIDNGNDDDDEFPIDVLEVEELGTDKVFHKHTSVEKKQKRGDDSGRGGKGGRGRGRGGSRGASRAGQKGCGRGDGGEYSKKVGNNCGGIKKNRGSKKRLGRSRRVGGKK